MIIQPIQSRAWEVIRAMPALAEQSQVAVFARELVETEIRRLGEALRRLSRGSVLEVGTQHLRIQARLEEAEAIRDALDLLRRRLEGEDLPPAPTPGGRRADSPQGVVSSR